MKVFLFLFTIVASTLQSSECQEPASPPTAAVRPVADPLDQIVETAKLNDESIFGEIARLNQTFDIPISIEGILPKSGTVTNPKFTAAIHHQTIAKTLDWLCTVDARYTWTRDGSMVNVFPRSTLNDDR